MEEPRESLLVFSDVHLGSDLDDCQGLAPRRSSAVDCDLVALLAHYRKTPPEADRWHIVIAGDFIDFIGMAISPDATLEATEEDRLYGIGSAPDHVRAKFRRVVDRHADVFTELGGFVADGHALTIIHGNHDIELHWDVVQDDLRAALLRHARVQHDAELDADAFSGRIAFNPWFFWRDGVVFIEHGHQYDPFCATPHIMAPLSPLDPRRIARGFCEILLRHVVRQTRGMSESGHEHVGLVYYLRFGARLGLRGMTALGLRFAGAVRELFRIRAASFSQASRELRAEHERRVALFAAKTRVGVARLQALLALQAQPITSSVRGILASVLLDRLAVALVALLTMTALGVAALFDRSSTWASLAVLPCWALSHIYFARGRHVDPTAQMAERAAHLAKLFPAAFVVMGHTHVPTTRRAGPATYINVGSWAENETETERAARTHLVIVPTPCGAEARFCRWEPTGPALLKLQSPAHPAS